MTSPGMARRSGPARRVSILTNMVSISDWGFRIGDCVDPKSALAYAVPSAGETWLSAVIVAALANFG
jgi:hypothetical protein